MRTLAYENFAMTQIGAGATATITSPVLRPRLEGYEGAIRGPASDALYVDSPTVVFDFRPSGALTVCQVILTITRFGVLGQNPGLAAATRDITGDFILARGNYEVDCDFEGVVQVQLAITNNDVAAFQCSLTTQVFGKAMVSQIEREVINGKYREPGV